MYPLDQDIAISGEWWLPDNPGSVVAGQLHFDDHRIEVTLQRVFTPLEGQIRPGDPNPRYQVIHGTTTDGHAVSLFDAQQVAANFSFGSGGYRQLGKIIARVLFIGAHLPPEFAFPKVSFRIPGLQVWLGRPLIAHEHAFDESSETRSQKFTLRTIPKEQFTIDSIDAVASFHYGWTSKSNPYSSIAVDTTTWIGFEPKSKQTIDWFLQQQERILTMISFLAGHVITSDAIQANLGAPTDNVEVLVVTRRMEKPEQMRPDDFFLSRAAISIPISNYCNRWFELAQKVDQPASLARSVMASKRLWLHMTFLSLMQALEGLDRAIGEGKYMEDEAYATVRQALIDAIPKTLSGDHRDALKSKVRYGNQFSLRKRLNRLASSLSDESRAHIFGVYGSVPQEWIDTRHYYTHWDEELLPNVLSSQSMYNATVRMQHFIRVLYATLIGVPDADIHNAFRGVGRIAQQLAILNEVERREQDPGYLPEPIMTISSGADGGGIPIDEGHENDNEESA